MTRTPEQEGFLLAARIANYASCFRRRQDRGDFKDAGMLAGELVVCAMRAYDEGISPRQIRMCIRASGFEYKNLNYQLEHDERHRLNTGAGSPVGSP